MEKNDTKEIISRIKAYYRYFDLSDPISYQEWVRRLLPYRREDIERRFEEHLTGEERHNPPMLHLLISNLSTEEQLKKGVNTNFLIRCNLCGKEMSLSHYDNEHHEKCLIIGALKKYLKEEQNKDVSYEDLDKESLSTLNKIWDKYHPVVHKIDFTRLGEALRG